MRRFPLNPPDPEWWVPKTDVYISEDGRLVIEVELAAMKKEDLELTIEAKRLIIRSSAWHRCVKPNCVSSRTLGRFDVLQRHFGSTDYSCICTNNPSPPSDEPCPCF